ncbi:crotonase/enoyl-CoA hydratase family protein [Marinobacter zhejiangensis]|uniref:Enoyl-CoA hydratase n=1 Tax=Marinobacter zhejiangensis TaxID=488535 RepID=A0A1I4LVD4_9GAMM|nr:crotonase/enoyl-CoA hydratase family protein [Marinobacter zhejiangensis]SFL95098.1 enoyl-CoA hydratase [Marinobacter zhejiangensis]
MTNKPVNYERKGSVAVITLDDGKSNALSPVMLTALSEALDRAEQEQAVVLLQGREGIFSAGFDLKVLKRGGTDAIAMLRGGFDLALRLMSFPTPVVVACTGHAMAMGAFVLLSSDYRIGVAGDFKVATNEVAIGMTMPKAAVAICQQRLNPAHFTRAVLLAETFTPESAVAAGFLDQVVAPEDVHTAAFEAAEALAKLDMTAHHQSKLRSRGQTLRAMRKASLSDTGDFLWAGAKRYAGKLVSR